MKILPIVSLLFGLACLTDAALAAADVRTAAYAGIESAGARTAVLGDRTVVMRDGEVVITATDGSQARITPTGNLLIRGGNVSVTSSQRALLQQYSAGIRDIQQRGLNIGESAVGMVGNMLSTLVASALNGGEQDLDARMRAKAEPLKEQARALCKDVQLQQQLQDRIAAELPAFRPYAVIDTRSEHDCHVDDEV